MHTSSCPVARHKILTGVSSIGLEDISTFVTAQFALIVDNHASFDDKGHKHGSGDTGIRYDTGFDLLDAAFRIPREG